MKRMILAAMALAAVTFAVACGGNTAAPKGNQPAAAARPETPADFKDKKNALNGNADAIKAGESTFKTACVSCHGTEADGNSDAGKALKPQAGNLRAADFQAMSDGYIFWRITKGGVGANISGSAMQAFDAQFTDDQRWQLVAYLRSLSAK
ncbi:cytochrome c-L [Planctomycetaceae bacterium]|nr:cytochrome c-L [Planctomycetaceae bacterium]